MAWTSMLIAAALCQESEATPPAMPTPVEVMTRAFAARERITCGKCDVRYVTQWEDSAWDTEFHIAFDGDKRRVDRSQKIPSITFGSTEVTVTTNGGRSVRRTVITPEHFTSYCPDIFSNGGRVVVVTGPLADAGPYVNDVFDIRLLGLNAGMFGDLYRDNLERGRQRWLESKLSMSEAAIDGKKVFVIERLSEKSRTRIWIAPSEGYCALRSEIRAERPGRVSVSSVECRNRFSEERGLWFPELVKLTRTVNGQVEMHETVTVTNERMNVPVNPRTFTMAGLDIERGRLVRESDRERNHLPSREWDGQKLVPASAKDHAQIP